MTFVCGGPTYVVAIPNDGLVQGEALGLLFCYRGSGDDDLPVSEVFHTSTVEEANELVNYLRNAHNINPSLHPAAKARFAKARVIRVDDLDIDQLAREVAAEPQPTYTEKDI